MYKEKTVTVLIAAGGRGQRMGGSTPKQFLNAGNKTILEKSTEMFENNISVDAIYIIGPEEYLDEIAKLTFSKMKGVLRGGPTRQESVYNGILALGDDTDILLIHDAARPFTSDDLINDVIAATYEKDAVIPAIAVKDTIKLARNDVVIDTFHRESLRAVQTPQGFDFTLIKDAHEWAESEDFAGTDDAQLVERLGEKVYIIPGEESNIKITVPQDLPSEKRLVGLGFDVHGFSQDRELILGGIEIPYDKGLLGHSDADVLTHALMDAILGALNLGDIGTNFPDTDQEYKDIRSTLLLEKVRDKMIEKGYTIENTDLIIVAEKPKMKEHSEKIRKNLAGVLKIEPDRISIKATTTEGLGFTGREEGIGAQAIVQLIKKI